ncbi:OadG family protein [Agathobaculum sp.]|uniref:OadG family protein n=1 Tax=Agathobaculum sp. TaxID=2048138 RepID=UPI002A81CA51|nr:OadG family protein [Agathobaculum sp.]MDY3619117.1 OadG family protein [Agathobaculum sp.]
MPGNLTGESFLIALSGIVIVFLMLAVLSGMIVVISKAVGAVTGRQPVPSIQTAPVPTPAVTAAPAPVRLDGVNDLTAACIMAIVSDELGVTPDQLVFRSIKAL